MRTAAMSLVVLGALAPTLAHAEENLYQKRDRLQRRLVQIQHDQERLGARDREVLAARMELEEARARVKDRYFATWMGGATDVLVRNLLPNAGTLAKNVLRKILGEDRNRRYSDVQSERLRILDGIAAARAALDREHESILREMDRNRSERAEIERDLGRIGRQVAEGPPTGRQPSGREPTGSETQDPEALIPALSRYFAEFMAGSEGNLQLEYTRPWHYNRALSRFECNYRVWKTRPGRSENPQGFRRHVAASSENPLSPTVMSLGGARQIVKAGRWLR